MSTVAVHTTASSTGQTGTEASFLDGHFESCRPEYEEMLRSVGLQRGWRVLDAACGSGSFLPLIAEQVGPDGSIAAFDIAPENVARAASLVDDDRLCCPLEARVASFLDLPYPDGEFDAVWCANALEYLSDEDLPVALSEFRRVVRPGGLVAIKEADGRLWMFSPADPALLTRAWEAAARVSAPFHGTFRRQTLRRWLEASGLEGVWQRGTLSEIWAPLTPIQRRYIGQQLMQMAVHAESGGIPEADLAFWRQQNDPASDTSFASHPDLFWCEGHFVTVGRVPTATDRQR
jgi:ubiquinone/menaquinone biosynthesis C-methylase UbiE